jgi:hypothetical protein
VPRENGTEILKRLSGRRELIRAMVHKQKDIVNATHDHELKDQLDSDPVQIGSMQSANYLPAKPGLSANLDKTEAQPPLRDSKMGHRDDESQIIDMAALIDCWHR